MLNFPLDSGWTFKARQPARPPAEDAADPSNWAPAQVPGCVHLDLMAAGHLADPFIELREKDAQWVGERDWWYRCAFSAPPLRPGETATLTFEGLDTVATIWLNGVRLAASDNMHVPLVVAAGAALKAGANELLILFESALRIGRAREREHGPRAVWNGDASRVFVRKAQYHYGWDWGPTLLTAGVWQPARLEIWTARLKDVRIETTLNKERTAARLTVYVTAEGAARAARVEIDDPAGRVVAAAEAAAASGAAAISVDIPEAQLWYPRGMGAQPLYTCRVTLAGDGGAADARALRFGLRDLRVVQAPVADEPGSSFTFEVNGVEVFCGGANWIPADSFTPRVTPADYRRWLERAANANMRMLRVWGGGVYEPDVFYDLCDELGLLVWQDFMFACGMYPAHDAFAASVRAEATAVVARLRHHPSLAIWAGNNEDYQIAESTGAYERAAPPEDNAAFPARHLYERILPEVVARLDPGRFYWPGSPYTVGGPTTDPTRGDRHTWDIWHGAMADYQDYPAYEGRFVSEFGMASAPRRALVEATIGPAGRSPRSEVMDWHNKASDGPKRIATYLTRNVCDAEPDRLDDYIYLSQFIQAEAMLHAFGGWRRRWGRPGARAVSGALVWQLNDCWPVTSWAIADYEGVPKPAWYMIRRALAPLAVSLRRGPSAAKVWVASDLLSDTGATLDVAAWTLDGERVFSISRDLVAAANAVTETDFDMMPLHAGLVVSARLRRNGATVSSAMGWQEPYRQIALPDPGLRIERMGGDRLRLRVARPAKGVWLDAAGPVVAWSDNGLDLAPDEDAVISAAGLGARAVSARWLGAPAATVFSPP